MNDEELGQAVGRTVVAQVSRLHPSADMEALFERVERADRRRTRWLVAAVVIALLVGVGVGAALFPRSEPESTRAVLVPADGVPGPQSPTATFEPADPEASRAAIESAFSDAFAGGASVAARIAATQDGAALEPLHEAIARRSARFGYTLEQLAGTTVDVLDVSFIDDTHAVVKLTLTIPGHGDVLVDRVGYAIFEDGRWKVALRTSCDLLSLGGLGEECPPSP